MTIIGLDHVQLAMPTRAEAAARHFFGTLLGLDEVPKPPHLAAHGGCWFALADRELHLGIDPHFQPAKKAHVALVSDDLAGLRQCLAEAGCPIHKDAPVSGRQRFFTEDPFGNRLEIMEKAAK